MNCAYTVTPLLAWLVAGSLKFVLSSLKARQWAFYAIGYGGMPSNHSAIVTSTAALIAFREGIGHPAFGVALTLAFVVMLDANGLRRELGRHAAVINQWPVGSKKPPELRECMGHSRTEIAAGVLVGIAVAAVVQALPGC